MKKNMMRRNLRQSIKNSMGRYIAIVAIIALGAGLFCGLRVTKKDMVATVQRYTDEQNMFDLRVMNTYGWTADQVSAMKNIPGIADAEGGISLDALLHMGDNEDQAYKLISIPTDVNRVSLDAGRMPTSPDECLLDGFYFDESFIGTEFQVSANNDEDTLDNLAGDSYTVVGLCSTPLYLNMQRGSTSIGSGSLVGYLYLMPESFTLDAYTEVNLTLEGDYKVYTDTYNDTLDDMAEALESPIESLANDRRNDIVEDAEAEYADGLQEYEDGLAEYETEKADALEQLSDAEQELLDAEQELADGEQELADGKKQLDNAQATLNKSKNTTSAGWAELKTQREQAESQIQQQEDELTASKEEAESGLEQVESGLAQIEEGLAPLNVGIAQLNDGIAQIEDGIAQVDDGIAQTEGGIAEIDSGTAQLNDGIAQLDSAIDQIGTQLNTPDLSPEQAAELEAQRQSLEAERAGCIAQRDALTESRSECEATLAALQTQKAELETQLETCTAQLAPLQQQLDELVLQQQELLTTKATLEEGLAAIDDGFAQIEDAKAQAETEFAAAEKKLNDAEVQIASGQRQLNKNTEEWNTGMQELEDGRQELEDGWAEYESSKAEAYDGFAEAELELADAEAELADARKEIDDLAEPDVYILTRNTNVGYVVFENDSDIVNGVSKIFPAFFLAVAALVCITTMTRMIDEERTQIGILKALGYSNFSIMWKYLAYSGSGAILGCTAGVLIGCVVFPQIIWYAYCIMYNFSDQLVLTYDIPTIAFIVASYTALTLLVTWYCCRRSLSEVPAELIRPKAPAAGKKVFLEKLPVWRKLKFLNKVAIRNIFRYRQRLAMMLLGIGGCTALLVTGFGMSDSISGISNTQFESVMVYDIGVTFSDPLSDEEQEAFREEFQGQADQILFCQQSGIDLEFDDSVKSVNFLAAEKPLDGFIDLHNGKKSLSAPGENEALISIGAATSMGIDAGDTITIRNSDMEEMELTVSGIFDNNVYNYVIVTGQTMRSQWNRSPEMSSAFVVNGPQQDVHELGANITKYDGVLSVSINQDTADTVNGMMDALDAVVALVVVCAGLLASIVLYNLTNINIRERVREIATIKVLGFNAGETGAYVFKENLALTVIGILLGLIGGKFLHAVVMSYIRIDMVWFENQINWISYVISAALTMLAAIIVDFIMYFQLDKINMAEALKSVE